MLPSLGMTPTKQQERFGDLFLHAVASVAGCDATRPSTDDDSIDWTLSCRLPYRPKLDIQMKTTSTDDGAGEVLRYPLKVKNYSDLIVEVHSPRMLVVVCLPADMEAWLSHTHEQISLRRCAYWVSLAGQPASDNLISVTVSLPRMNRLTVEAIRQMMQSISERGTI